MRMRAVQSSGEAMERNTSKQDVKRKPAPEDMPVKKEDSFAMHNAMSFFAKYDRYEMQEVLAMAQTHHILSGEEFKVTRQLAAGFTHKH